MDDTIDRMRRIVLLASIAAAIAVAVLPTGGQSPAAMAIDASGRVYVAGTFEGEMTVGSVKRTAASKNDVFVIRCDP